MARASPVADLVDCSQQRTTGQGWSSIRGSGSAAFQSHLPRPQYVPTIPVEVTRAPDPVTLLYAPRRVHYRPRAKLAEMPRPVLPQQELQPEQNPMEDMLRVFEKLNAEAKKRTRYERKYYTPYDTYTDYLHDKPRSAKPKGRRRRQL